MSNIAVDKYSPKTFEEIYGNENLKSVVKTWIKNNDYPYLMFVTGPSGCGKGTLINNFIKTTLCLNRQPGESVACGHCQVCTKIDPRSTHDSNNVLWVQTGKGEGNTINSQFKKIEEFASSNPTGDKINAHRYHKFIVIDEAQEIPPNLLSNLLFLSEVPAIVKQNSLTFIVITMDEERLYQKNPNLINALKSRSGKGYLPLNPPTDTHLDKFCTERLKVTDPIIRSLLVEYADRNYRMLIAGYEALIDEPNYDLTYAENRLKLASPYNRKLFWKLFSEATYGQARIELKNFWDDLVNSYSETRLLRQLLKDLDNCILQGQDIPINLIITICQYLNTPDTISAWYTISTFAGKYTINPPFPELPEDYLNIL